MDQTQLDKLRFPIGNFEWNKNPDEAFIADCKQAIIHFPTKVKSAIENLTEEQYEWIYRPDGWTIRQVIHHCADSHMNSFVRFKLALTEDIPTIKPYEEALWSELPDSKSTPVEWSIAILEGLHKRWEVLLNHLDADDLERQFIHPSIDQPLRVKNNIDLYAWHSNHHLAHIQQAIAHQGKF